MYECNTKKSEEYHAYLMVYIYTSKELAYQYGMNHLEISSYLLEIRSFHTSEVIVSFRAAKWTFIPGRLVIDKMKFGFILLHSMICHSNFKRREGLFVEIL